MPKSLIFVLSDTDIELQKEITLAGVINSKLAKGDYIEEEKIARIKEDYDEAIRLNSILVNKLRKIRRFLDENPDIERIEDNL